MKRKISVLFTVQPITASGSFANETSFNETRHQGIEIYSGVETGWITIFYQKKEIGVPIANVKNVIWEIEDTVETNKKL